MFPGDKYKDAAHAINKYKYVKGILFVVASGAFALTVMWPNINGYFSHLSVSSSFTSYLKEDVKALSSDSLLKNKARDIRFFGTDKSKQPYLLIADSGQENKDGIVMMEHPQLTLHLESGHIATLTATKGNYNKNNELIELTGEVVVTHSTGYQFITSKSWIELIHMKAYGDQAVQGEGPQGKIYAPQGFELSDKGDKVLFLGRPELILHTRKPS